MKWGWSDEDWGRGDIDTVYIFQVIQYRRDIVIDTALERYAHIARDVEMELGMKDKAKKLIEAIRLYCKKDCQYREKYDIHSCRDTGCALWPYRVGVAQKDSEKYLQPIEARY